MKARKIIEFRINIQISIVLTLGIQAQGYFPNKILNIISWCLKWKIIKNILILAIFITIMLLLHEIGYFRNEKS